MNGLVLLGWVLIRRAPRPDGYGESAPPRFLTMSNCLCEVRPHYEDWYEDDGLGEFVIRHQVNVEGNFIFLDTPSAAREMNEKWCGGDMEVFGVALDPATAQKFDRVLVKYTLASNPNLDGLKTCMEPQAWQGTEKIIGYDLLGYDHGLHCYLCSHLGDELHARYGSVINGEGLINDAGVAAAFAEDIKRENLGEPGFYFSAVMLVPE